MLVRVMRRQRCGPRSKHLAHEHRARPTCASRSASSRPRPGRRDALVAGEVGFVIAGIKELRAAKVGDTITLADKPAAQALPGFKEIKPQVFAGLYPVEANEYEALREALEKLHLNDASLPLRARDLAGARLRLPLRLPRPAAHGHRAGAPGARVRHAPHHHRALGGLRGASCATARCSRSPTPRACRPMETIEEIREPMIATRIFVPQEYVGPVITLCDGEARHADQPALLAAARGAVLRPAAVNEVVLDFFDRLKSADARLRLARLRVQGVPRRRRGAPGHPGERRARRRALDHGAPRQYAASRDASSSANYEA